jgi:hypothetical protein
LPSIHGFATNKYPLMRDENKTKTIVFSHVFACNSMNIGCIASPGRAGEFMHLSACYLYTLFMCIINLIANPFLIG